MATVLEALDAYEKDVLSQDQEYLDRWKDSPNRERFLTVLSRLDDLDVLNIQSWPTLEFAVTFGTPGHALWIAYNGYSFNIWTNFGGAEDAMDGTSNIVLSDDEETDNRQTAVRIVRDYFKPDLVEAT